MERIEIRFLGTGSAIPSVKKNHSAFLVSFLNENVLVDCGEGTQRQFRYARISPCKINRLLITHWHGDHVFGIPGLIQTLAMSEYSKELKIYGPEGTREKMELIKKLVKYFHINMDIKEVKKGIFVNEKNFYIEAMPMLHGIPCIAFSIILKDKIRLNKNKLKKYRLPRSSLLKDLSLGKDIIYNGKMIKAKDVCYKDKGKKVTFILDTKMNDNMIRIAKDSDLLVIESSFSQTEKERAKETLHLTAYDAGIVARKAGVKRLVLTHISQRYDARPEILVKEAKKNFKNVNHVKDLDVIKV